MITIISPAKTQDFSKTDLTKFTIPEFLDKSEELMSSLNRLTISDIMDLMSVSEKIAELNFQRFRKFNRDFSLDSAKQALLAFKGDVYVDIESNSYSEEDFDFAQHNLRIISGLYGILKPLDLIMPYRLEMKTKLTTKTHENLYKFWNNILSKKFDNQEQIVNLASNEYSKALINKNNKHKFITPIFKEYKNDSYRIIAIFAKRARGLMTNHIIKNRITNAQELRKFSENGYVFDQESSDNNNYVFLRKQ